MMIFKILLCGYFIYAQYIIAGTKCYDNHFFNGSDCLECPSACASCVSESKCTRCMDGFFNDLCNTPCLHNCSGKRCHLKYGHCTYGCQDGQFFSADHKGCSQCPKHCALCISMSKCLTCQDGYFGDTCSKICPPECRGKTCNHSTGPCFQCKEGYVRQNESDSHDESTKEYRTLIIVVVVVVLAFVIFILLIGAVAFFLKLRFAKSTGCPGTPEVDQILQPIQSSTRQDHLTSSLHRAPSVESLYDRANCLHVVSGNQMYNTARNTQHRYVFHTASGFQCVSDNREFNKSYPTLREKADDIYDTTFHSKFKTNNARMNMSPACPSHMPVVDSDVYDGVLFYQSAPIPTRCTANTDIAENSKE